MSTQSLGIPPLSRMRPPPNDRRMDEPRRQAPVLSSSVGLIPALTLAIWFSCLAVGVMGFLLRYETPHLLAEPTPVVAKIIQVNLSDDPTPGNTEAGDSTVAPTPPDNAEPPPPALPSPVVISDAPPLMAVATPDPAIVFAIPVETPSRVVDAKQAAPAKANRRRRLRLPADLRSITSPSDVGEGAQAKPEYPREAVLANQQGVVGVRFTIAENGKVISAEIVPAVPLADAQSERRCERSAIAGDFLPGDRRVCDVPIHFELK